MAKVWPIADDFVLATRHRLNAISLLAGTLNSVAAFSMAAASLRAPRDGLIRCLDGSQP
jgi:hypothetical protein